MPNGGSDCCITCWFNSKNFEKDTYQEIDIYEKINCSIRNLKIEDAMGTYCVNHPHHNPKKSKLPIGPVYIDDQYPFTRKVWVAAEDSEQVRLNLLELLNNIKYKESVNPASINFKEEIIYHLRVLKEKRAIEGLKEIIEFGIAFPCKTNGRLFNKKNIIIGHAIEALLDISNGEEINDVEKIIDLGINKTSTKQYSRKKDSCAVIRYHLVRALKFVKSNKAIELLTVALSDPHSEIQAFAKEILGNISLKQKNIQ